MARADKEKIEADRERFLEARKAEKEAADVEQ